MANDQNQFQQIGNVGMQASEAQPGLLDMAGSSIIPGWVMEEWNRTPEDQRGMLAQQYNPANWTRPIPPEMRQVLASSLGEQDFGYVNSARDPLPASQFEQGAHKFRGHGISPNKLYQDTHRPVDTQEGAGIVGGSMLPYRGFPDANAWSTKGQVGYFGQIDPFWTSWGAGGP